METSLPLDNIQSDILIGMRSRKELFYFFGIENAVKFKAKLKSEILPLVTSARKLLDDQIHEQKLTIALNIAFSQAGLNKLNIKESDLNDTLFKKGQLEDAADLGDGPNTWLSAFNGTQRIHGVILLASNTTEKINGTLKNLKTSLGDSITEIHSLYGAARPDDEEGHEHFGFLDGISNPFVNGSGGDPSPGQALVPAGEIFLNTTGDSLRRPDWAKNGSFLVFRQLQQLVPEFNKFLADNPVGQKSLGLTKEEGSQLLGARMVGRWKSGAPVFLTPDRDDPELARNISRNNNFTYVVSGKTVSTTEECPFSAHIRKTRPRQDLALFELSDTKSKNHIIRAGIPYGPEVSWDEASSHKTNHERGLAFVCYQSSIANGFQFLQQTWANNPNFVQGKPGFDPIIGSNASHPREVFGLDPDDLKANLTMKGKFSKLSYFVVSKGGEYFFSPSLSAIKDTLSV
ncbi:DyP-type peroxidase [Mycena rebaudengoi]|nr:DyP-type peroxidase [Mycena rebaudengoi]